MSYPPQLSNSVQGSEGSELLQKTSVFDLLVQLRNAGIEIDPRSIRALTFGTDSVDTSGSSVSISGTPDVNVTDRATRLVGIIYGSQGQQIKQDAVQSDLVNIDIEHSEVHGGNHYVSSILDTSVNIASPKEVLLITPDTSTRIHLTFDISSDKKFAFRLFEDTTVSANGSSVTAHNNDRNSANTATLSVFEDPTVTSDGTEIFVTFKDKEFLIRSQEFILKQNTKYLLRTTPTTDGAQISIASIWYEVT